MKLKHYLLALLLIPAVLSGCKKDKTAETPVVPVTPSDPDAPKAVFDTTSAADPFSWVATDGLGESIDPGSDVYPDPAKRTGKYVGIFYFLWHGCHGYDQGANHNEVVYPTAADTKSPYDNQKLLDANPSDPEYGPGGAMHHWGEPYLGYYLANDEWVIRKHAQMLSDAGVDVIIFDATNGYHYLPIVKQICEIYTAMRAEGNATPQFMFLLNANTPGMLSTIYNEIYSKDLYKDLWFKWLGKPLVLADPDQISASWKGFFNYRRSWFLWNDSGADSWFGNGIDKWPWGGLYPQQAGRHGSKNESVSVMPATHPVSNIGRSYNPTSGEPSNHPSGEGLYFKKQFERANSLNPSFLFFTGWNEWTAQKQVAKSDGEAWFLGHPVTKGEAYFVDQYNHEFSRDIEPLNGDFGDNYYYMFVDFIRKFKGTKALPTFTAKASIAIDGDFADWKGIPAIYGDDKGDVTHRNHIGWGRLGVLTNDTGRNDFVLSKVTNDGTNLYFYVRTASDITSYEGASAWMQLFIRVTGGSSSWEGFNYVVNRSVVSPEETKLQQSSGGWKWSDVSDVKYKAAGNMMEVAVPLSAIGITTPDSFSIDFKWIDDAASDGDIQTCLRDGDSAPDGRFRYRYTFKK